MPDKNDHQKFFELVSNNERIRKTLQELGVFIVNYKDGATITNNLWNEWGYGEDHNIEGLDWIDYIHPDDKVEVLETIDSQRKQKNKELHKTSYRFKRKDGSYAWIITAGKYISYSDDGLPGLYIGSDRDISELKRIENTLKETIVSAQRSALESDTLFEISTIVSSSLEIKETSNKILNQIFNLVPFDIGMISLIEDNCVEIISLRSTNKFDASLLDHESEILIDDVNEFDKKIIRHKESVLCNNISKDFPNLKNYHPLNLANSAIGIPLISRGKIIGLMSISSIVNNAFTERDYSLLSRLGTTIAVALDNSRLHEKMTKMALRDSLTKLLNRYGLSFHWDQLSKQVSRRRCPLSLVIIDIDMFKNINDAFGHETGDRVIQVIAKTLKEGTRESDLVARIGGEEFLVVLPEVSIESAILVANKIRSSVESLCIDGINHPVTISLGVSATTDMKSVINLDGLIREADKQLYLAKKSGRNRIMPNIIN